MNDEEIINQMRTILEQRSHEAIEIAKKTTLNETISSDRLHEALRYFLEEIWFDEIHPGLISLACEAVGGDPSKINKLGAAMVLLAGSADIHDDVIDGSRIKYKKKTVFGKFGGDTAILAGDALLFEGLCLFHESCNQISVKRRKMALQIIKKAFFEITSAETTESNLQQKFDFSPKKFMDILEMKVAVAEATMKLGALFGGALEKVIEDLGEYGRTFGTLLALRDEIIDVFDTEELQDKVAKGCLPLPILLAFEKPDDRKEIMKLLNKSEMEEKDRDKLIELVMESQGVEDLKLKMQSMVEKQRQNSHFAQFRGDVLGLFLRAMLQALH